MSANKAATTLPASGDATDHSALGVRQLSLLRRTIRRMGVPGLVSVVVLVALLLVAAFAPMVAPYDPTLPDVRARLQAPSAAHHFGTDHLGRDILSRVVHGSRIAFAVGLAAAAIAAFIGVPLGLLAGFYGGLLDRVISGITDVLFSFPTVLLAVALVAVIGPSLGTIAVVLGVLVAPTFTRVVRAVVLATRALPYVEAAFALGMGQARILLRHVLPATVGPVVAQLCLTLSYAVIVEASLSYIGLGVRPPAPSWGGMLLDLYGYLEVAPWGSLFPGLAIVISVVAANVAGDALLNAMDPVHRGGARG